VLVWSSTSSAAIVAPSFNEDPNKIQFPLFKFDSKPSTPPLKHYCFRFEELGEVVIERYEIVKGRRLRRARVSMEEWNKERGVLHMWRYV